MDTILVDVTGFHTLERKKDSKETDILEKPGGGPHTIRCYGYELQQATLHSKDTKKARIQTKCT